MDYEDEWEFLPDPRFLDFPVDSEKKILSGKRRNSYPTIVFDTNYFMCPSSTESQKIINTSAGNSRKVAKQFVPVPIQLKPAAILNGREEEDDDDDDELNLMMTKEVIEKPVDVSFVSSAITEKIKGSDIGSFNEADQDAVSQVFFKKFVDMKTLDSPKSPGNINIIPQVDQSAAMENMNPCSPRKMKNKNSSSSSMEFDTNKDHQDDEINWEEQNSLGLNLWKWSLSGIGAICSFGVAAATVFIIVLGNQHRNNKHQQQNQKLRFQIYTDDKRSIKQVVQQATKMNEAISTVRGVPITRAHITFGGYYDSL